MTPQAIAASGLVTIEPGDPTRPTLAALFAGAFAGDAHIDWLLPCRGDRKRSRLALFECLMDDLGGQLVATADRQGAALWFPPGDTPSLRAQARFFQHLLVSLGPLAAISRGLDLKRMDARHPTKPHYYLQLLAAAPESRRRGIGRALVSAMLDGAHQAACPAYLETSNQTNLAFYQNLGFTVSAETRLSGGLTLWSMVYPPPRAGL